LDNEDWLFFCDYRETISSGSDLEPREWRQEVGVKCADARRLGDGRGAWGGVLAGGVGLADTVPLGLGLGNAKVADGDAENAGEDVDVGLADGEGVGVGVGVGGGGIIFSQWCSGTLAPPISLTNASQRAWSFSKSGGPNGLSAVPGKTKYVTFRSLTGRLYGVDSPLICFAIRSDASPTLSFGPMSPTIAGYTA
jgi:hypothetical protein